MDRLEEHIRKNRNDLDRYDVPENSWKQISKRIKQRNYSAVKWLSVAAMAVMLLGTAVVLLHPGQNQKNSSNDLSMLPSQLKETEIYYNNLINVLYNEATPLMTGKPEIKHELNSDLSQIDSICSDLKKDLKDNIANQDVVEALIRNYRIKISILEDMLTILKENENKPVKKNSHEL